MVALNTAYAPENPALGSKNRVGNFFGRVGDCAGENRPATRNRIGEKRLTLTITASGRPYWPSRDPVEEFGGINLYAMVINNPVNYWDNLGLTVITYEPRRQSGGQVDEYSRAYLGNEILIDSTVSSSVIPSDSDITVNSLAAAGSLDAYSSTTITISCDGNGKISYSVEQENDPPSGSMSSGDLSVGTYFHVQGKPRGSVQEFIILLTT